MQSLHQKDVLGLWVGRKTMLVIHFPNHFDPWNIRVIDKLMHHFQKKAIVLQGQIQYARSSSVLWPTY